MLCHTTKQINELSHPIALSLPERLLVPEPLYVCMPRTSHIVTVIFLRGRRAENNAAAKARQQ